MEQVIDKDSKKKIENVYQMKSILGIIKRTERKNYRFCPYAVRMSHQIQRLQFPSVLLEKTSKVLKRKWIHATPFYEKLPRGTTCT